MVKPGDSGVVIGYQVMNVLAPGQQSVSLLDHTFMLVSQVRCPHLPTSHLNQAVRIAPFWTRQWKTLNMARLLFLTESVNIPVLDASLGKAAAILSSVPSGFLCSVSTISDTFRLQLAPSIKYHKLWCSAFACPVGR